MLIMLTVLVDAATLCLKHWDIIVKIFFVMKLLLPSLQKDVNGIEDNLQERGRRTTETIQTRKGL